MYVVKSMGEKEVSSPKQKNQGCAGEIGKHLRYHSNSKEKTFECLVLSLISLSYLWWMDYVFLK